MCLYLTTLGRNHRTQLQPGAPSGVGIACVRCWFFIPYGARALSSDEIAARRVIRRRHRLCAVRVLYIPYDATSLQDGIIGRYCSPARHPTSASPVCGQVKSSSNTPVIIQRTRRAHKERGWYAPHDISLASCPSGRRSGWAVRRFDPLVTQRGPRRGFVLACSGRRRIPPHSTVALQIQRAPC